MYILRFFLWQYKLSAHRPSLEPSNDINDSVWKLVLAMKYCALEVKQSINQSINEVYWCRIEQLSQSTMYDVGSYDEISHQNLIWSVLILKIKVTPSYRMRCKQICWIIASKSYLEFTNTGDNRYSTL